MLPVSGFWPTVVLMLIFCVIGFAKGLRKIYEPYVLAYYLDGKFLDQETSSLRKLKQAEQAGQCGFGFEALLDTIERLGWEPAGEPTEFSSGSFHRITLTIRRRGSRANQIKVVTMEVYPERGSTGIAQAIS